MSNPIIQCQHLAKSYLDGKTTINVLNGINFSIDAGDKISIVGPSGSGKSTFLHLLGGLDNPTKGQVCIPLMERRHGIGMKSPIILKVLIFFIFILGLKHFLLFPLKI